MWVRVRGDDTQHMETFDLEQEIDGQPPRLFLKVVEVPHVGRLTIEVLALKGEILATSTVHGTDEPFHPWIPLDQAMEAMKIGALASGTAFPDLFGVRGKIKPSDGRLPRLFPAEEDPDLKIEKIGSSLRVTSRRGLHLSMRNYLSRWWVSGRAFQPGPIPFQLIENREHPHRQEAHTFALPFNAQSLGARKGETIRLQILYCPQGWSQQGPRAERIHSVWDDDDVFPRVSNEIEFTAE